MRKKGKDKRKEVLKSHETFSNIKLIEFYYMTLYESLMPLNESTKT